MSGQLIAISANARLRALKTKLAEKGHSFQNRPSNLMEVHTTIFAKSELLILKYPQ
jgi:hypothetical protein